VRPARPLRLRALGAVPAGHVTARQVLAGLLTGTVLATGVLAVGGPAPAAAAPPRAESSASLSRQVERLRADIDRVGAELAAQASAYEAAEQELAELTQRQFAARADSEALQAAEADTRDALHGLARSAYKGGMPPMVTAILSGNPRVVSDLAYVQRSVNRLGAARGDLVADLVAQQAGAGRALEQSDVLRREALTRTQALEEQRRQLAARTAALTADLQDAGSRLARARAAEEAARAAAARAAAARAAAAQQRAAAQRGAAALARQYGEAGGSDATGGACGPPSSAGEVNGFLSAESLCPLEVGGGHRLRTDAAKAFDALNRARIAATGAPLCVTDSYRSYASQVDVFQRKPHLAATPGRSQHGWGLAVDLGCGVQTFGTEANRWMYANAPAFGWIHPAWARPGGSRPEPWHWEYVGAGE
jgi:hypothetical protein